MSNKAGFALIIVVALLGIMAYLGVSFSSKSKLNNRVALQYVGQTKARLIARSGVEKSVHLMYRYGLSNLSTVSFSNNWKYAGEDINRDGVVDSVEDDAGLNNDYDDIDTCPLELAACPSFAVESAIIPGVAEQIDIDGRKRGYSWKESDNGYAALKIISSETQININGGMTFHKDRVAYDRHHDDQWTAVSYDHPYNRTATMMLNALGDYFRFTKGMKDNPDETYVWDDPNGVDTNMIDNLENLQPDDQYFLFRPTIFLTTSLTVPLRHPLGYEIILNRPTNGYQSVDEVEEIVKTWAQSVVNPKPDPNLLWQQVKPLLTVETHESFDTRIWRQWGLPRSLHGEGPAYRFSHIDAARTWLRTRSYVTPRQLYNINLLSEPVLASLIHSVGNILLTEKKVDQNIRWIEYPSIRYLNNRDFFFTSLKNNNLFTIPESIQLAKNMRERVVTDQFNSWSELYEYLIKSPYGFDFKGVKNTISAGALDKNTTNYWGQMAWYTDAHRLNMRHRILWCILNPNGNLRHFITDEALPSVNTFKAFRHTRESVDGSSMYLGRVANIAAQRNFDKSYSHDFGGEAAFFSQGAFHFESEGIVLSNNKTFSREKITSFITLWNTNYVTSQKDFADIFNCDLATGHMHNATTMDLITYPEIINNHIVGDLTPILPPGHQKAQLASWDGAVALRPSTLNPLPAMAGVTSRFTFNPYESEYPTLQQLNSDSSPVIKWKTDGAFRDTDPGDYNRVPWPPYDSQTMVSLITEKHDAEDTRLDYTSHLYPGGGFYPDADGSTRYHNFTDVASPPSVNRRMGGLYFEDKEGKKVIQNIEDGAVSFYYKPKNYPLPTRLQFLSKNNQQQYRRQGTQRPNIANRLEHCLFDYSFFLKDSNIRQWVDLELEQMGYDANPNARAGLLLGNIRLLSGTMWNVAAYKQSPPFKAPTKLFPLNNNVYYPPQGASSNISYSGYIHDGLTGPGSYITPVETFLFDSCKGLRGSDSRFGWLNDGDYSTYYAADAFTAGKPYQPYVADKLWLEFKVTMVIEHDIVTDNFDNGEYAGTWQRKRVIEPPLATIAAARFYDTDQMGDIYERQGFGTDLYNAPTWYNNMFHEVTKDLTRSTGFHTIVKSFRLDYPIVFDESHNKFGVGPRDGEGIPHGMMAPGRWHHILIAWRNMYNLLALNQGHKGGAIVVYHNGTIKKSINFEDKTWDYNSMQWHTDFSTDFYNRRIYGETYSSTPDWNYFPDNPANKIDQWGHSGIRDLPVDHFWPASNHQATDVYSGIRGSAHSPMVAHYKTTGNVYSAVKGFGMENTVYPSFNYISSNPEADWHYLLGSTAHFSMLDARQISPGTYIHQNYNVMYNAVHKFFFGSAPNGGGIDQYGAVVQPDEHIVTHMYPADGLFMDVTIAESPSNSIFHGNAADQGFATNIPGYSVSPYAPELIGTATEPNNSRLFPFKDSRLGGGAIMGFAWTAYLPEFHQFWDDKNSKSYKWNTVTAAYDLIGNPGDAKPGPDLEDQMVMRLQLQKQIDNTVSVLDGTNWNDVFPGEGLYVEQAREKTRNVPVYILPVPEPINEKPYEFSLKVHFRVGDGTHDCKAFSTPLIDDLSIFTIPSGGIKYRSWRIE